jgi:glycosyltransferase involved in cell wall biosynthesis
MIERRSPTVSVVLPVYNLGRYLDEAVESVLAQTLDDVEVLVVDDGSSDAFTRELLAGYERPKTRVLAQENRGVSAARNYGIRHAQSRYIVCLDADDKIRPSYLEKAVALLDADEVIGFVTSDIRVFGGDEDIWRAGPCRFPEMLFRNRCHTASVFRRSAWERAGGYCETLGVGEDWDLWLSLLELGYRCQVIPEVMFEYRVRTNSQSHGSAESPENQGRMYRVVWERHRATYASALGDVAELVGSELARRRLGITGRLVRLAAGWRMPWAARRISQWSARRQRSHVS